MYLQLQLRLHRVIFILHTVQVKDIGDENLGEFGKITLFEFSPSFLPVFTISIKFPMQMDLNSPKFFCQTSYNPYSPNLFAIKVFTVRYCMLLASFNNIASWL